MWAIYKLNDDKPLWYVGSNGNWSNDRSRAARWPDRRDAWQAIKDNGYVGRANTGWVDTNTLVNPNQIIPEER
jgi:hypothetical protein